MRKRSKRYQGCVDAVGVEGLNAQYSVAEAVALVKKMATASFPESVEMAFRLGIDTRKSDQLVRGSFSLPNGTGRSVRVIAFCDDGAEAEAAIAAGAIEAGGESLAEKVQGGWMEFDVAVAHPKMMRFVGKLGKVLGPKGLMPSPKSGTVTDKVVDAVKEFSAGRIEFRNDNHGNICVAVGRVDFDDEKLAENIEAMLGHIKGLRPTAVKGVFILSVTVSSTMGPGIQLAI